MKTFPLRALSKLLFGLFVCALTACFSQKDNVFNRNLQNLTSRYNILYNANEILDESEQNLRLAYPENYDRLISVYQEPNEARSQSETQRLDEVILKANKIISEKTRSHYVNDAYYLIAKANHLKSNFFNAIGFFDYVYQHYEGQDDLRQGSMAWKARSLLELELFEEAQTTLDSVIKYVNIKKKSAADVYAVRAQLYIYGHQDEEAIVTLSKALKLIRGDRMYKIRWTYLLAQLQHLTGKRDQAYANYTKVVHSNADFNMSFNANLNRISIEEEKTGTKINRVKKLKKLLKNGNNTELIDQIYFHIGKTYQEAGDIEQSIKNYKLSAQKSTKNQNQKGISYLKLADIYFASADYIKAKLYYDSTLSSLTKDYPDYQKIKKKASNIELLADRLRIIAEENNLQKLADLPEAKRNIQVDSLVAKQIASLTPVTPTTNISSNTNQSISPIGNDQRFYFNNTSAISQGITNFKKNWGNRILEDDWRRSQKANSSGNNISLSPNSNRTSATNISNSNNVDSTSLKQFNEAKRAFLAHIPITPDQRLASDRKIASAYFDIANHYREVINDSEEAIRTYEKLLALYPKNNYRLPTYYNLYRLYQNKDSQKSAYYRNLILNEYPESIFAKTILNPSYSQQENAVKDELNHFYNEIYCSYADKQYDEVLQGINWSQSHFGVNKLSPQLAYLNSLAIGHRNKLDVFEASLKRITTDFTNDSLIVPLVQKHLLFIDAHRATFVNRPTALVENESAILQFIEEPQSNIISISPNIAKPENELTSIPPNNSISPTPTEAPVLSKPKTDTFFSTEESVTYYFVVNVTEFTFNLSSSRFGIGQFNRIHFPENQIKHQLKLLNKQNQLIFVGTFSNKKAAAEYYQKISPLISQIMKIPSNKYNIFYISQPNADKIINRETLNQYIEFFNKELY